MPMILIFTFVILFILFIGGIVYIFFSRGDEYHSKMKEDYRRRGWEIKENKDE